MESIRSREENLNHPDARRTVRWLVSMSLPWLALFGCAPGNDEINGDLSQEIPEEIAVAQSGLVISTFPDTSSPHVQIQVKACTADNFQGTHTINCSVDQGYALVGGGAYVQYTAGGALLTESRPVDGLTWRASSKEHQNTDGHKLTTYAVGLHLDGVNGATLRSMVSRHTATSSSGSNPSVSVSPGSVFMSGGARASTSGVGQLLRRTYSDAAGSWLAAAKDHIVSASGTVTAYSTRLNTSGIIEPLGKIEFQQSSGSLSSSGSGVRTATGSVSSGWALAGYGANSSYTSGSGRLLFRAGINGTNVRSISAQSKDHGSSSTGTIRAHWTQVRHVAGSHGLCNPGPPLQASMDPCVATICATDAFCCSSLWDPACVAQVPTKCGKSCTNYTCSTPSYTPTFWNDWGSGPIQDNNNCYNYANNTRTDSFAQPGYSSGGGSAGQCSPPFTVACVTEKAMADGLIPSPGPNQCDFDQQSVAMAVFSGDYHWWRLGTDGFWSHKPGNGEATNLDNSGNPITDPATADRGNYITFGGYFCTCSDQTEGQGHAVIDGPF